MRIACARIVALALLVLPMALDAPSSITRAQEATPPAAAAHVLRIGRGYYPDELDPHTTDYSFAVPSLVFEGLTRQDETLNTVPAAAESWEFSDDGLTLTFRLRDGLTYSDGTPLTAERFRYAIQRECDPFTQAPYVNLIFVIAGCEVFNRSLTVGESGDAPVATPGAADLAAYAAARADLGVRAIDDRTLEIALVEPAAYLPALASTWLFYPIKEEVIAAAPDDWWRDPARWVGNGPFVLGALTPGEDGSGVITFAANERYWGGRPQLDEIVYRYFGEDAVYDVESLAAYKRGELEIISAPYPYGAQPEIADDPVLSRELLRYPVAATWLISFNLRQEPFQDKQVREAFASGFDREGFCRDVWLGACVPTTTYIPEGMPAHIPFAGYVFDPEAARAALAASTYGGPENLPEIVFRYGAGDSESQDLAEWIANNYRENLGVEITIVPTTDEEWDALAQTGSALQLDWWFAGSDYPDPKGWLSDFWTCNRGTYAGPNGYCNPEADALVAAADTEGDPAARLALYEQAQRLILDDAPAVFAFNDTQAVLVRPSVTGYVTTPVDAWPDRMTLLTIDVEPPLTDSVASTPVP
ncbi:MAG: peptide ABC transporter substrate-binding protein [Thermomicrobiales bacterium]|nr:peptide ABC transporter substrate-binding protein [Thermomicrobiales bacterium]